jgi:putative endonuclease
MCADDTPPDSDPSPDPLWSVYVVRRSDGALYTGIATNVVRRLAEHEAGEGRGAKSLRGRGPLTLVFAQEVGGRGLATRIEAHIKRLSKARKENWIQDGSLIERVLKALPKRKVDPLTDQEPPA